MKNHQSYIQELGELIQSNWNLEINLWTPPYSFSKGRSASNFNFTASYSERLACKEKENEAFFKISDKLSDEQVLELRGIQK